jgi:multidrug resistance efflux pump
MLLAWRWRHPQRRGRLGLARTLRALDESTDDAYVNGNVVEITPLVTGTVVSIGADDGDLVHEGQVLVNFDPNDAAVGLQSAQANLAAPCVRCVACTATSTA